MLEAGVISEGAPVELIDGELWETAPQGPAHNGLTVRVHRALERAFGESFHVQDHSPIDAGPYSRPEPDLAVVPGEPSLTALPGGDRVALVVEIAVTAHREARAKLPTYAAAGVAEVWILDVPGRRRRSGRRGAPGAPRAAPVTSRSCRAATATG